MLRRLFTGIGEAISSFIKNPIKVLGFCLAFVVGTMVVNGNLFRLWRLHTDSKELASRIEDFTIKSKEMDQRLLKSQDPQFIELQARERFDLVNEGDLVFVFSDEE